MDLRREILRLFNESEFRQLTAKQITDALDAGSRAMRRRVDAEIHQMYFDGIIEPAFKVSRTQFWMKKSAQAHCLAPGLNMRTGET